MFILLSLSLSLSLSLLGCTGKLAGIDDTAGTATDTGDTGSTQTTATLTQEGCTDRHQAFIAALQADLDASDAPGVSAAIMEDGVVTCRIALGYRAPNSDSPPDIDTLFQLGSTTKMFTAVAVLQAVQDGKLSLDTTLADAYPNSEFALDDTWNDAILIQHLLTHQGEFYDYFDWSASADDGDLAQWHDDVFFPNLWLMADPGSFWNYSNPNFDIAGLIAEYLDGRAYPDIMAQDVFRPLGMDRTYQRKTEAVADGNYALGVGYTITSSGDTTYGDVLIDDVMDVASARPAGAGTWSTPTQVLEMARFLMEGDSAILADDLRQAMTQEQVSLGYGDGFGGYGYALFIDPGFNIGDNYYVTPLLEHGGNTLSYSSAFYMVPSDTFAVAILSSGYGTDFSNSVATAISELVNLPEPSDAPAFTFDPDRLDLHTGTYEDAYNIGEMDITRVGDGLKIALPFLESLGYVVKEDLVPMSSDLWYLYLDGTPYDLTFIGPDDASTSQWVRNRAFVGTRIDTKKTSAPPSATPDHFDRAELQRVLRRGRVRSQPSLGPSDRLALPLPLPR